MTEQELAQMDATAQAELVRSGDASPSELVEAAIERAERLNPDLNAIIHEFYEEAAEQAKGELPDGPFRGVPFVLKDLGAGLAGQPYHLGMQVLKDADFRLPMDTTLGARFRDAGFVTKPQGREDILIRVAAQVEEATPWADRHPPVWAGAEQAV